MATKRANLVLFHILKSIVDKKVPGLKSRVDAGPAAKYEIARQSETIKALDSYLAMNRYENDPEAEDELKSAEDKLRSANLVLANANAAEQELNAAKSFNKIYQYSLRVPEIERLRDQYRQLEFDADRLDKNITSCEISMELYGDMFQYIAADAYNDVSRDYAEYTKMYEKVTNKMAKIAAEIKYLERG